jgi:hypothetical protein
MHPADCGDSVFTPKARVSGDDVLLTDVRRRYLLCLPRRFGNVKNVFMKVLNSSEFKTCDEMMLLRSESIILIKVLYVDVPAGENLFRLLANRWQFE